MTVKPRIVWTKGRTWIQKVKQAVTWYNLFYSVFFLRLYLYHLKHKAVGLPTTDEEKKIFVVMGEKMILFILSPFLLSPQHFAGPFPPLS